MIQRVLMTTDTVGGVWTYALELCRGLGRRGVEVALATMGAPLDPSQSAEARYEPFGLSILEAALAGCALVLGDVASLRELWDGCALFVPPEDADALEATLDELIHDAVERRRRALDVTPERMVEGYLQAYREAGVPRWRALLPLPRPYPERFLVG